MNITVNEQIIKKVFDEQDYVEELSAFLNSVIDAEIEKDDIDTELIDDCTDLLYALQFGGEPDTDSVNKLLHIYKTQINREKRKRQIAAAIMIMLIGTGALLQTNPAIAEQTRDMFSRIAYSLGITAEKSENGENIKSLYANFDSNPETNVKSEDEIDLTHMQIIAVGEDGKEFEVPLSDCEITKTPTEDEEQQKIIVTVAYKGTAFSITYTIEG
ncbi:MAG: hypothetical protein E7571_08665 [Ruminococcaceae bacterium]|nr:hypothetical protein [Oscillospiraceae bacterium]